MKLFDDRLIVKPIIEDDITEGGILIPDSAKQHQVGKALVEVVGQGGKSFSMSVSKGDTILYDRSKQIPFEENKIINQSDVIFIL